MTIRSLRTTAFASRVELADALQCVFVSEILAPSTPLWIVTPWISDVPIIDNRSGRFAGLIPALPERWIRLGEIIEQQLIRGGSLVVACRPRRPQPIVYRPGSAESPGDWSRTASARHPGSRVAREGNPVSYRLSQRFDEHDLQRAEKTRGSRSSHG